MLIFKNITDQVQSLWYTSHFLQFHCHLFSCLIVLFVVFHVTGNHANQVVIKAITRR